MKHMHIYHKDKGMGELQILSSFNELALVLVHPFTHILSSLPLLWLSDQDGSISSRQCQTLEIEAGRKKSNAKRNQRIMKA